MYLEDVSLIFYSHIGVGVSMVEFPVAQSPFLCFGETTISVAKQHPVPGGMCFHAE